MPDLDPELREAYAAFQPLASPSPDARARTWVAVANRIVKGETGPALESNPAPSRSARRIAIGMLAFAAAVIAALSFPVAQSLTEARRRSEPIHQQSGFSAEPAGESGVAVSPSRAEPVEPPRRRSPPRRAPLPSLAPPAPPVDVEVVAPPAPPVERKAPRVRRRVPTKPAPVVPARPPVREEATQLARARAALARHAPREALRIVQGHAERFPSTVFARERTALELLARCELGAEYSDLAKVDAFVRSASGSALARRVERACGRVTR